MVLRPQRPLPSFTIINRYSHRIQELSLREDGCSVLLLKRSVYEVNMLPNLKVLSWQPVRPHSLALIQPLLGPQLLSFNLTLDRGTRDHKGLRPFLKTSPSRCPALKAIGFHISSTGEKEAVKALFSRAICALRKLDCLAVHGALLDDVALRQLVLSPQFTHLLLATMPSQLDDLSLLRSDTPFPSARRISLSGPDISTITGLLRSEGQAFHTAELHLGVVPIPHLTFCFLTALASCTRQSSLHSITLDRTISSIRSDDGQLENDDYILSYDILQPLALFHNLRGLDVDLKNPISLNDDELADLARGWPLLQFLRLASRNELSARNITLRGLLLIVAACPELGRVDLCLDAREVPMSGEGMDVSSVVVTELNFSGSPVDDPRRVAMFLLKHLASISSPCLGDVYAMQWVKVGWYLDHRDSLVVPVSSGVKY